ncbi:hypothetical protein [Mangrovactinospora gilvigrisea]|uniref:hypothetical protein n=1 Tax=Mangrovactinospora gilvigrisea TaxID=1428644 RepID=UPI000A9D7109|nr:hypothetical protein [Mangrovactinospora gilvigrisea]
MTAALHALTSLADGAITRALGFTCPHCGNQKFKLTRVGLVCSKCFRPKAEPGR